MLKSKIVSLDISSPYKLDCREPDLENAGASTARAVLKQRHTLEKVLAVPEAKAKSKNFISTKTSVEFTFSIDLLSLLSAEFSNDQKLGNRLIGSVSGSGLASLRFGESSIKDLPNVNFRRKSSSIKIAYRFLNDRILDLRDNDSLAKFFQSCNLVPEGASSKQRGRVIITGSQNFENKKISSILKSKSPTFDLILDADNDDFECVYEDPEAVKSADA
jgi:hypothetical protein